MFTSIKYFIVIEREIQKTIIFPYENEREN